MINSAPVCYFVGVDNVRLLGVVQMGILSRYPTAGLVLERLAVKRSHYPIWICRGQDYVQRIYIIN